MNTRDDTELLEAIYAESVDREREAWAALHSLAPGTPQRASAWDAWSQAIMRTNQAWRKLSAARVGHAVHSTSRGTAPEHAHA